MGVSLEHLQAAANLARAHLPPLAVFPQGLVTLCAKAIASLQHPETRLPPLRVRLPLFQPNFVFSKLSWRSRQRRFAIVGGGGR